jgi:hypothetical protein
MVKHRFAPLAIDEIFELANSLSGDEQLECLSHYTSNSPNLKLFMELYKTPLPDWIKDIKYRQPEVGATAYNSVIGKLKTIIKLLSPGDLGSNQGNFELIMETITLAEVMFMEHYIQGSLEDYYPNIDFTYFGIK